MHLTLKKEATKPASGNFLQQQARFDKFLEVFNNERPHEALGMTCQAEIYQSSTRPYQGLRRNQVAMAGAKIERDGSAHAGPTTTGF
jgi:transposase InsO family protein